MPPNLVSGITQTQKEKKRMQYKLGTKLIASMLLTAMLVEMLPAEAIAEGIINQRYEDTVSLENSEGVESVESASIVGEIPELREESVKHFLLDEGTYVAVEYSAPVHYLKDDGSCEEIAAPFWFMLLPQTVQKALTLLGILLLLFKNGIPAVLTTKALPLFLNRIPHTPALMLL